MTGALLIALTTVLATVACSERATQPAITRNPVVDSAEQVMYGISTVLTDRGVRTADLRSDTALFFDEGTRAELRKVHLTFYTQTGVRNAVLTSLEGTYDTRQSRMEARGSVVVVSDDGRRLETEQLRYDQLRNEISSDSAFVLTEPGRRLRGIGFTSDPNMTSIKIKQVIEGAGSAPIGELETERPAVPPSSGLTPPSQGLTPPSREQTPPPSATPATPASDTVRDTVPREPARPPR